MTKIILEKSKCIGCGSCVALCEKLFEMGEDGKSHLKKIEVNLEREELEVENVDCGQEAAQACPVQCITIKN